MVQRLVLCQLKPEVGLAGLEQLLRQTHSRLLRIAEFRTVVCGKRIEADNVWGFFFAVDFESLDKMHVGLKTPAYQRFEREVLAPQTGERMTLVYESEPGKDIKYS